MRTYHPGSWSEQAREKAALMYVQWYDAVNSTKPVYPGDEELNEKEKDPQYWVAMIANSYRAPIIRYRAVKSFKRLVKKNKKIEFNYGNYRRWLTRLEKHKRIQKKEV